VRGRTHTSGGPKGHAAHQSFNASRERAGSESFKATASEVLTVFPVVLHFAQVIVAPSGKLGAEVKCLEALGAVIALCQVGKLGACHHTELTRVIATWFKEFLRVYGLNM